MESRIYYAELYDFYGNLLTQKQQAYFEDYYFQNLTLSELSENYEVSRNAIHKQIKEATEKLEYYETVLQLREKNRKLELLFSKLPQALQKELKEILE